MDKTVNNLKRSTVIAVIIAVAVFSCIFSLCACTEKNNGEEGMENNESVLIQDVKELEEFFKTGTAKKAILTSSVELGNVMLTVTSERKEVVVDGAGHTLTGAGDCVIRIENGSVLTLENITIAGGADVIGCMQDAYLNFKDVNLKANATAVRCKGKLFIGDGSIITVESESGYGISANSVEIGKNSKINITSEKNAVKILKKRLLLGENSSLSAVVKNDYSAVECSGTLVLNNGSEFAAKNEGSYHGVQADYIEINGAVTIKADGGSKGAGMFLFQLEEDYTVKGHCKSALRKENGHGSIEFDGE